MAAKRVIRALDMFCGGGGSSLGARMAGVQPVVDKGTGHECIDDRPAYLLIKANRFLERNAFERRVPSSRVV